MKPKATPDLVTRLRQHAAPAVMGCTCRSDQPNCPACDCGRAADVIERLRAEFLDDCSMVGYSDEEARQMLEDIENGKS